MSVNLIHKSRNSKHRTRKIKGPEIALEAAKISKTEEPGEGGSLAFYLVLWLATCLSQIAFFDVGFSAVQAQVRHLYNQKEKTQLSELP